MKVSPKSDNEFSLEANDEDLKHLEAMCRHLKVTPAECLLLLLENGITNWLIRQPYNAESFL